MPIYHAAINFTMDTLLPRDVVSIHPHFQSGPGNGQTIADNLKTQIKAVAGLNSVPFAIKVYDAQAPKPNYPLGTATNAGTAPTSVIPREIALCLSYYSGQNIPGRRGRLYLPQLLFGGGAAIRPTATQTTAVRDFANVFKTGYPASTKWCVFSRRQNAAYDIDNYWVDDEWDVVRSRGLKGTTRVVGVA